MRWLALLSGVLLCLAPMTGCDDDTVSPPSSTDTVQVSFQDGFLPGAAYDGTTDAVIKDGPSSELRNGNFGAADSDTLGTVATVVSLYERRLVIRFDLSSITSCSKVISAELAIRIAPLASGTMTLEAHRVTKQWIEGTGGLADGVSWTTVDGADPWIAEGGDFNGTALDQIAVSNDTTATFSLAPIVVKSWILTPSSNYGVIIKTTDASMERYTVASLREYGTADRRPRLDVTYLKGG